MFTSEESTKLPTDEEILDDVMFEDDNTTIGAILILKPFSMLQKPSLTPNYDFGLFLSSEKYKGEEEVEANKHSSPIVILENNQGNETQANPFNDSKTSERHDDAKNEDFKQPKSSSSDTGSSGKNIANPFSILELRDNVASTITKVDSLNKKVAGLDSKIDQKVSSLDSKLDLILKSVSKIQAIAFSKLDCANQLDQLISCHLKHTIEEVE